MQNIYVLNKLLSLVSEYFLWINVKTWNISG